MINRNIERHPQSVRTKPIVVAGYRENLLENRRDTIQRAVDLIKLVGRDREREREKERITVAPPVALLVRVSTFSIALKCLFVARVCYAAHRGTLCSSRACSFARLVASSREMCARERSTMRGGGRMKKRKELPGVDSSRLF